MKAVLILIYILSKPAIVERIPMKSMFACQQMADAYNQATIEDAPFLVKVSYHKYEATCVPLEEVKDGG